MVQTPGVVAKETEISYLGIGELAFSIKKTKKFHFGKHGEKNVLSYKTNEKINSRTPKEMQKFGLLRLPRIY